MNKINHRYVMINLIQLFLLGSKDVKYFDFNDPYLLCNDKFNDSIQYT